MLQHSSINIISLERHNSRVPADLIELLRGKKVMLGAIDVATHESETPEAVANTLRDTLRFVDAEMPIPSTNCGMVRLPRQVALDKLSALNAGASPLRNELTN